MLAVGATGRLTGDPALQRLSDLRKRVDLYLSHPKVLSMQSPDLAFALFQEIREWPDLHSLVPLYAEQAPPEILWKLDELNLPREKIAEISRSIVRKISSAHILLQVYLAGDLYRRSELGILVQSEIPYKERARLLEQCVMTEEGFSIAADCINLFGVGKEDLVGIEKRLLQHLAHDPLQALRYWTFTEHLMRKHMTIEESSVRMLHYASLNGERWLPDVIGRISRIPLLEKAKEELIKRWRGAIERNPCILFPTQLGGDGGMAKRGLAHTYVNLSLTPALYDKLLRSALRSYCILPYCSKEVVGLLQRSSEEEKREILHLCSRDAKGWVALHLSLFGEIPQQMREEIKMHFQQEIARFPSRMLSMALCDGFWHVDYSPFELAKKMGEINPAFVTAVLPHFKLEGEELEEIQRLVGGKRD